MALADYFTAVSEQVADTSSDLITEAQALIAEAQETVSDNSDSIKERASELIEELQESLTGSSEIVADAQSMAADLSAAMQSTVTELGAITSPEELYAKVPAASGICENVTAAGTSLLSEMQTQAETVSTQVSALIAQLTDLLEEME